MKTKSILMAATGALLVTGLLADTAKANILLGTEYDAVLTNPTPNPGPSGPPASYVMGSEVTQITSVTPALASIGITTAMIGEYEYQYWFGMGGNSTTPADAMYAMSVYFDTTHAGVTDIGAFPTAGGDTSAKTGSEVDWNFNPGVTSQDVYFVSPLTPALGYTTSHDGGNWEGPGGTESFGVVVPNVPDGGMTVFLLGGALLGIGAFRRKLGC